MYLLKKEKNSWIGSNIFLLLLLHLVLHNVTPSRYAEKFDSLLSLLILEDEEELDTKEEAEGDKSTPTEEAETKAGAKENSKISGELAGKAKMPANEKAEEAGSSIGEVQSQKKKKNILVIVEELRTLRDHQADLISQLMTELSHMERENCQLKSQVCLFLAFIANTCSLFIYEFAFSSNV